MFRFLVWIFLAIVAAILLARSRPVDWRRRARIGRLSDELLRFSKRYCPNAKVLTIDVKSGDRDKLAFLIQTDTDRQRDQLREDPAVFQDLPEMLRRSGFPATAMPSVHLFPESQETVDREFGGNWREAVG